MELVKPVIRFWKGVLRSDVIELDVKTALVRLKKGSVLIDPYERSFA